MVGAHQQSQSKKQIVPKGFLQTNGLGRWVGILKAGLPSMVSARFSARRTTWTDQAKVLSFAMVPIFVGDDWWGYLVSPIIGASGDGHGGDRSLEERGGALGAALSPKDRRIERQHRALTEACATAPPRSTVHLIWMKC